MRDTCDAGNSVKINMGEERGYLTVCGGTHIQLASDAAASLTDVTTTRVRPNRLFRAYSFRHFDHPRVIAVRPRHYARSSTRL